MQMSETNQEFDAFTAFMDKLVKVPHSTIKRGITIHRKKSAANPNRTGPKPKRATTDVSRASAERS